MFELFLVIVFIRLILILCEPCRSRQETRSKWQRALADFTEEVEEEIRNCSEDGETALAPAQSGTYEAIWGYKSGTFDMTFTRREGSGLAWVITGSGTRDIRTGSSIVSPFRITGGLMGPSGNACWVERHSSGPIVCCGSFTTSSTTIFKGRFLLSNGFSGIFDSFKLSADQRQVIDLSGDHVIVDALGDREIPFAHAIVEDDIELTAQAPPNQRETDMTASLIVKRIK